MSIFKNLTKDFSFDKSDQWEENEKLIISLLKVVQICLRFEESREPFLRDSGNFMVYYTKLITSDCLDKSLLIHVELLCIFRLLVSSPDS